MENKKYVENEYISISNGCYFVNKIERKHVEKTNELRFFKLYVEFADGRTNTYVFPSFVKFYSNQQFLPFGILVFCMARENLLPRHSVCFSGAGAVNFLL